MMCRYFAIEIFITIVLQFSPVRNDPMFSDRRSGQTVETQMRLLLEEQSNQGLHGLLFHLHLFDEIQKGLASKFLEF